jgi:hypothetical protein
MLKYSSLKKQSFHLIEIIEFAVAKAWWAVSFIAVNAEVAILICLDNVLAPKALAGNMLLVLCDHALMELASTISVLLDTLVLRAET